MLATRIAMLLAAALVACAVPSANAGPGDGLANSAHDFSSAGPNRTGAAEGGGLCSVCHIPRTQAATRPAWYPSAAQDLLQETTPAAASPALAKALRRDSLKGPSIRCLSCHDGTVANGDAGSFRYAPAAQTRFSMASGAATNASARMVAASDHPVPMPYPFGKVANTYAGVRSDDLLIANEWVADPTTRNIRLYSDDGTGTIVSTPRAGATGIECSSCHDPHNKAVKDRYLLRGVLHAGSQSAGYLCLQCHDQSTGA